ncbi:MAG: molybdate ABC transporter substrate-binding protein [Coprococcus sp.]
MKKMMSILLVLCLAIACLAGCGSSNKETEASSTEAAAETEAASETEAAAETEAAGEAATIQVFIAASLSNAMEEIASNYAAVAPEVTIVYNAGSSGKLQTQIEEGGACDIFFSAATKQMTALVEGGYVNEADVTELLENKVQLIKPVGGETNVTGFENITDAANLALAADTVPVGQYAREIFENLGITDAVMAMEINECEDVSAVLAAVSEGSNEVGVVYATDAASVADKVEVIATADDSILNTKVIYPVGLVQNAEADDAEVAAAKAFIAYLMTPEAAAVFEKYGFSVNQ